MPKALAEKANKLRLELAAINDKLEALSREERALREAASGASGREREKLLREAYRKRKEWDSLWKTSMDIGIRLSRIEEILRKGGE